MFKWTVNPRKQKLQHFTLAALVWLVVACKPSTEAATPTPILVDPGPAECDQRILAVVWGDLNGDGVQDSDEPPLEGVLLRITAKGDPPGEGMQLSTGENGQAYFPTRELDNCQTAGYQVLFLRQVAGFEFPAQPVVNLDNFDPLNDTVHFGLLPVSESGNGIAWPSVVKTADGYAMYFAGTNNRRVTRIGLATSADGIVWQKYNDPATEDAEFANSDPVLMATSEWEEGSVDRMRVVNTPEGFSMIYQGGPLVHRGF